ncbi:MAG TPA: HAMP domain-containing sensor histidine kinase [Mycobacteriales bacterium]|nr:HAMP domain-containing sensor histidine kinase [Mycobacteriales bacterium]
MTAWWRRRSLRARLTFAATVVLALAMSAAAVLLVWRVHLTLISQLDATASRQAVTVVGAIAAERHPVVPPTVAPDAVIQVVDRAGNVVASSPNIDGEPRLFTVPAPRVGAGPTVRTVANLPVGDNSSYRVAAVSTVDAGGAVSVVYVALPLAGATRTVAALSALVAAGVPIVVGLLAAITWLLVGRAIRPVELLRRQAADITVTDLHRRVSVPPSGDEMARLASTLNDLLARLDASVGQQRQFVADAAHELRSPMASLLAQLEVDERLARGAAAPGAPTGAGSSELVEEARRLSVLIDALLALARLDAQPRPRRDVIDLDDVVFAEVATVRRRTGVPVDTRAVAAARVCGDAGLLARVVRNLLDNAARHARSQVIVRLEHGSGEATLTVTDDGPGVPAADRGRIFARFTRLDEARGRDAGGVGLGLAIVDAAVQAHSGSVSVTDASPGAVFTVRLPAAD